jgi:S1-C subfamily serine protease
MRQVLGVLALVALSGCATNGFEKYYTPLPAAENVKSNPQLEHPTDEPKVYTYSNDPDADNLRLAEDGYQTVGTSSFYGPANKITKEQAIAQAKNVGASVVLVRSDYKDTLSGVIPYTVPNPDQVSTVSTSGTVSSYGSGGYATGSYSGQGTIVTPGDSTTYAIPYSIDRNNVVATFWVRQKPQAIRLGALIAPLPEAVRTKLQRNTGVYVNAVVHGTPAFNANILRTDVIVKLGGEDVTDVNAFRALLTRFAGQKVDIEIIRGDTAKTVTLTLNRGL